MISEILFHLCTLPLILVNFSPDGSFLVPLALTPVIFTVMINSFLSCFLVVRLLFAVVNIHSSLWKYSNIMHSILPSFALSKFCNPQVWHTALILAISSFVHYCPRCHAALTSINLVYLQAASHVLPQDYLS